MGGIEGQIGYSKHEGFAGGGVCGPQAVVMSQRLGRNMAGEGSAAQNSMIHNLMIHKAQRFTHLTVPSAEPEVQVKRFEGHVHNAPFVLR